MAENSKIEWTHHTFNPWEGCEKVSAGCKFCYAEQRDKQYHGGAHWGTDGIRKMMSEPYWQKPLRWDRNAQCNCGAAGMRPGECAWCAAGCQRPRVFCSSLADIFEDRPELEAPRRRLFKLIQATPNLDWLLLTKRPENILRLTYRAIDPTDDPDCEYNIAGEPNGLDVAEFGELYPNIWLGTTVENQEMADKRIPELLQVPAAVRFLSCEPLLGPVDLLKAFPAMGCSRFKDVDETTGEVLADGAGLADIHWVICGGESGPNARPMHPDWARSLRDQCRLAGVPFFFTQWGEYWPGETGRLYREKTIDWFDGQPMVKVGKKAAGRLLDGQEWSQFPKEGQ